MWQFILGTYPYSPMQQHLLVLTGIVTLIGAMYLAWLVDEQYPGLPGFKKMIAVVTLTTIGDLAILLAIYNFT